MERLWKQEETLRSSWKRAWEELERSGSFVLLCRLAEEDENVRALWTCMDRLEQDCMLCRGEAIVRDGEALRKAYRLFMQMLSDKEERRAAGGAMEAAYGELLRGDSRLDIIQWLTRRKALPQALVLASEWLPDEFFARRICRLREGAVRKVCVKNAAEKRMHWENYLLNVYVPGEKLNWNDSLRAQAARIREALVLFRDGAPEEAVLAKASGAQKPVKAFLQEYKGKGVLFRRIQWGLISRPEVMRESCPMLMEAVRKLWAWKQKHGGLQEPFENFLQNMTLRRLLCEIAACHLEVLADIFGLTEGGEEEAPHLSRMELFRWMEKKGILTSMAGRECLTGLRLYFQIRRERNVLCHGGEGSLSAEETAALLMAMIQWLREAAAAWALPLRVPAEAAR